MMPRAPRPESQRTLRIQGGGISPATKDESAVSRPTAEEPSAGIGAAERERAEAMMQKFLAENFTNVERAARKRDQAERLELQGIPSDSARNRAERARGEVVEGLVRLRRSLVDSNEPGVARALDLELENLDPPVASEELRR